MEYGYFGLGSTEWARELAILESASRLGVNDRDSAHWRELAYHGTEPMPAVSTAKPVSESTASPGHEPLERVSRRSQWWWRAVFGSGFGGMYGTVHRGFMMR